MVQIGGPQCQPLPSNTQILWVKPIWLRKTYCGLDTHLPYVAGRASWVTINHCRLKMVHQQYCFSHHSTMWCPPVISWFTNSTIYSYVRATNHYIYWSYVHQHSYRTGAPHCIQWLGGSHYWSQAIEIFTTHWRAKEQLADSQPHDSHLSRIWFLWCGMPWLSRSRNPSSPWSENPHMELQCIPK